MDKKGPAVRRLWLNTIIIGGFVLVVISCMSIVRSIMWKNTNEMGLALVKNYSAAEEQSVHTCEAILNICTNYIAERERSGVSAAELQAGLYPFMEGLNDLYGKEYIQMYGRTIGGRS